ncbi:MAG: hypothetical protein ABIR59_00740 [Gemmatimonadales bacterium]
MPTLQCVVLLALAGCVGNAAMEPTPGTRDVPAAVRLEQDIAAVANQRRQGSPLWPQFDPMSVPLAVHDGERTWFFRHPSPPDGSARLPAPLQAVSTFPGRHPAVTANSTAEIGGVLTATVIIDTTAQGTSPGRAALAVHEAFHGFQRLRHPSWSANEADLFLYPTSDASALALRRIESSALRAAVGATGAQSACWARAALDARSRRYALLDSASIAYERGTELNEGLASYVERKVRDDDAEIIPPDEYGIADVRVRAYASGLAFAVLLDRHGPGWAESLESHDAQFLDALLTTALGPRPACAFPRAFVDAATGRAVADIARLAASRAAQLATFHARNGWRVIIESPNSPLWPQGFDPINVERLTAGDVLHSRFLRLGNDAGAITMLDEAGADLDALTSAHGAHPLFNGIDRVEVAGLADPRVEVVGDTLRVKVVGLSAEFLGATVSRSEKTVVVRIGR